MGSAPNFDVLGLGKELLDQLKSAKRVVIGSHINPDGDAIGSCLFMSFALEQLGVEHEVLFHHTPPNNLLFLPGIDRIRQEPVNPEFDLALVLDLEALDRLGTVRPYFDAAKTMVVIDHHVPSAKPGHLRIVSTEYPATCSILTELAQALSIHVTPEMADCLATGILTDTGNFRYPNSTAASLHEVAWLVEQGADIVRVSDEVYMKKSAASVRLSGFAFSQMRFDCDDRLAYVSIPNDEFAKVGGNDDDTEGLVSDLLGIEGVEAAFLLRESKPGKIRGSVRSRGAVDVAAVAREFGGGGHKNAAGLSLEGDLREAERKVVASMKLTLSKHA